MGREVMGAWAMEQGGWNRWVGEGCILSVFIPILALAHIGQFIPAALLIPCRKLERQHRWALPHRLGKCGDVNLILVRPAEADFELDCLE